MNTTGGNIANGDEGGCEEVHRRSKKKKGKKKTKKEKAGRKVNKSHGNFWKYVIITCIILWRSAAVVVVVWIIHSERGEDGFAGDMVRRGWLVPEQPRDVWK